jgi:hypothetical protein
MRKGERARWEWGGCEGDEGKERVAERQPISGQEGRVDPAQQDVAKAESKRLYGYLAAVYHLHG